MKATASGRDVDGITMLVDCEMALISVFGVLTPSINRSELSSCLLIKAEGRYSVGSLPIIIIIADTAAVTGEALVVVVIAVREASKVGL